MYTVDIKTTYICHVMLYCDRVKHNQEEHRQHKFLMSTSGYVEFSNIDIHRQKVNQNPVIYRNSFFSIFG